MPAYSHTQRGFLHWILVALGGLLLVLAALVPAEESGARVVLALVGLVLLVLASAFTTLTVRDEGAHLSVAFGPLALFRRKVPYADVLRAAPGRSRWIDGWGIHWIPGRGWTWNVAGFESVELVLTDGARLRIGTDDSEGLAAFLRERCGHAG